jgi:hypothetical protein
MPDIVGLLRPVEDTIDQLSECEASLDGSWSQFSGGGVLEHKARVFGPVLFRLALQHSVVLSAVVDAATAGILRTAAQLAPLPLLEIVTCYSLLVSRESYRHLSASDSVRFQNALLLDLASRLAASGLPPTSAHQTSENSSALEIAKFLAEKNAKCIRSAPRVEPPGSVADDHLKILVSALECRAPIASALVSLVISSYVGMLGGGEGTQGGGLRLPRGSACPPSPPQAGRPQGSRVESRVAGAASSAAAATRGRSRGRPAGAHVATRQRDRRGTGG